MGRKTVSFSAAATMASLALAVSGVDSGAALAQTLDSGAARIASQVLDEAQSALDLADVKAPETNGDTAAQIAQAEPEPIVFTQNAVVQDVTPAQTTPATRAAASSLGELVALVDGEKQLDDELRCLAGAVYFESRGEPLAGQLAVAQVVINRSGDRRWPGSYCGVVYQRAQFSFVRDGRMPQIKTSSAAWERAKAVARIAHDRMWESEAGDAVYFHAKYVRPRWSRVKTRTAEIDTHIFYR
jgi:hypothetical protein